MLGNVLIMLVMAVSSYGAEEEMIDDLFGVNFPDTREGWVCGRWGLVYHTADGGETRPLIISRRIP